MKLINTAIFLLLLAVIGVGFFIWSGRYDVGADTPHWHVTERVLDTLRDRSIAERAFALVPPDLNDLKLIRSGAGNYDAMCVNCHLSPGLDETELSRGLYPQPPTWDALGRVDPREAFWAIKHGIKASGMPAWGKSMDDQYLWGMVAFLQQLPKLDAEQYQAQVEASSGHSHGGGETLDEAAPSAEADETPVHTHAEDEPHAHEAQDEHHH